MLQDRRGHLGCLNDCVDRARRVGRVGDQHHDVGVVMREAAVLGHFLHACGIDDADVRGDDDVRRPRIRTRNVEHQSKARPDIEFAAIGADLTGVSLECREGARDARRAAVGEPQQRDVVFERLGGRDERRGRRLGRSSAGMRKTRFGSIGD